VEKHGLDVTVALFESKVPAGKRLLPNWKENPDFRAFRELSLVGQKPAAGPVLLLQGLTDKAVTRDISVATYKRMMKQGSTVEYKEYPDLDHDSLVFGSFRDQLRWVQDRFEGKPVASKKMAGD
jgi:hypothetical protein